MTEPILVHKCWVERISHIYFKKESAMDCRQCRGLFDPKQLNLWLQESLVDEMNNHIFKKHRYEYEIENDADKFFNPPKFQGIIDKSVREYKEYKTSWTPKD